MNTASLGALAARPPRDPVTRWVREHVEGDRFLFHEVAEHVGITTNALRRLARKHPAEAGPGWQVCYGDRRVSLYDPEDVQSLLTFLKQRAERHRMEFALSFGRGRPPVWTHEEQARRHVQHAAAYYWSRRALALAGRGLREEAATARTRADQLRRALKAERCARLAQIASLAQTKSPAASATGL